MSATSEQIREALADALRVIPGLQVSAYSLSNPTPPTVQVMRGEVLYDQALAHGTHWWTMRVQAFVALVSDIGGQKLLDTYLSPDGSTSIKAAIEADATLGGVVSDLQVTTASGEQVYVRDQGGPVLGSEWTVRILL